MKNKSSKIEILVLAVLALSILSIGSCSYQIHKAGVIKDIKKQIEEES